MSSGVFKYVILVPAVRRSRVTIYINLFQLLNLDFLVYEILILVPCGLNFDME